MAAREREGAGEGELVRHRKGAHRKRGRWYWGLAGNLQTGRPAETGTEL